MFWALRLPGDRDGQPPDETAKEAAGEVQRDDVVRCAACDHPLTRLEAKTARGGAHAHTFVNPAWLPFDVRCFAPVPGAAAVGPPSEAFTWFPGYAWQAAVCAACHAHVGWFFLGSDPFCALIHDRIRG